MNFKNKIRARIYNRGKGLIVAAAVSFGAYFALFAAVWVLCPVFAAAAAVTLPFAVLGIAFWIMFGLFSDEVQNKCPSSGMVKKKRQKRAAVKNIVVVYHYSAERMMYKTNAA